MAGIQMALWLTMFISLVLMVTQCEGADSRCPSLSFTYKMQAYKNKCYQFYYGTKTWNDARDYCWQKGGHLANLNDPGTYKFVKDTLNSFTWNTDHIWIGLNDLDRELDWSWIAKRGEPGVPMTWNQWHEEHPEGWFHAYRDCVAMQKDGGAWLWHEATCNTYPWTYRFICEYEMTSTTVNNNHNGPGGIYQPTTPTTKPPPTTLVESPDGLQANLGDRTLSGEHRIGEGGFVRSEQGGLSRNAQGPSENKGNEGHVPLWAVIISFAAGVLFACGIILFIVLRRRRKRKETPESFPNVVYHAQPPPETRVGVQASSPVAAGGAVALAAVCDLTGKSCKSAIVSDSEKCSCSNTQGPSGRSVANPNVYVTVNDDGTIARDPASETNPSVCSSMRDMSILNEEPPTYDEACAGIGAIPTTAEDSNRRENVYSHEPSVAIHGELQQHAPEQSQSQLDVTHQGARPKAPKKSASLDTYLPMNGSPKTQGHNRNNSNQYVPMSLGELPPIPTDQGYEIPVSSKLEPEAVKSLHSPLASDKPITGADASIYAEIPERNSRHFRHDEEQIYQTID